jgi:hypothetical protein
MHPFLIPSLLFSAAATALFCWRLLSRTARTPVELKLLRGPGELSLRAVRKIDAWLPAILLGAVVVPVFLGWVLFDITPALTGLALASVYVLGPLGWVALVGYAGWRIHGLLRLRRELEIRYIGERAVAEELAPLLTQGYRIYHDVAIHGVESRMDLDMVLVGPTGVTIIEAEARPRPQGRDAARDHAVCYDGQNLLWPWGTDRATVASIELEAASFTKWLHQTTGYKINAFPLLTVPGWWVDVTGRSLVQVVNHKQVLHFIEQRSPNQLDGEQIEKICRELELHCRDVGL